jgi:MFS family permease
MKPFGLSRDNAWLALSTLLFGASVGFYQYVLPLFLSQLGANPDQVGLGLAVGNAGAIPGLLLGGAIVNRYSLRWQIITSWAVTALGGLLFVLAGSWLVAALALLLTTLALYGLPAYNAYIVLAREKQPTAEALTLVYVSFTVGSAATPALGGWLIAQTGMRAMFSASFVCAVASLLAAVPITERAHYSEVSPTAPVSSVKVGALPARRVAAPVLALFRGYADALANLPFRNLMLLLTGMYVLSIVGIALLPNYLHDRLGIEPAAVGALGTGAALVGVIGSLVLVRLGRRVGEYRALALGQLALAAGFILALIAPGLGGLALPVGGAGFALRGSVQAQQAVSRAMVAGVVAREHLGPAFALQSVIYNGSLALGPALAGVLYAQDAALPIAVALVAGLPFLVWLGVSRR